MYQFLSIQNLTHINSQEEECLKHFGLFISVTNVKWRLPILLTCPLGGLVNHTHHLQGNQKFLHASCNFCHVIVAKKCPLSKYNRIYQNATYHNTSAIFFTHVILAVDKKNMEFCEFLLCFKGQIIWAVIILYPTDIFFTSTKMVAYGPSVIDNIRNDSSLL